MRTITPGPFFDPAFIGEKTAWENEATYFASYKSQKTATQNLLQEAAAIVDSDLFAISDQPLFVHMRSQLHVFHFS